MEGFQIPKNNIENKKPIRERVMLPHVEAVAQAYKKHFGKETTEFEIGVIKEIMYSYFEQRIEKTEIYKSEKLGASFVYNITDTSELAKILYSKFNKNDKKLELNANNNEEGVKNEKEFMFVGGLVNEKNGNEYSSQEEVMHRMIAEIPKALQDISEGREPKHKEIYTLASPTNELGNVSNKFVESLKENDASKQFGSLYAELIEDIVSKDKKEGKKTDLYLNGVSMGAGFAIETAKKLIADNVATQSNDKEIDLPHLQLRIDAPVGQSKISEKRKKWQIPAGFGLEIMKMIFTSKYMRDVMGKDKEFIDTKNEALKEKGIIVNTLPEQLNMKKKVISEVMKSIMKGVSIPEDLKVTEVIGNYDPLMYSSEFNKKTNEQKEKFKNQENTPLGSNIVHNDENINRRTFGIKTSHQLPFLRDSEFKRLNKAVKSLGDLKKE